MLFVPIRYRLSGSFSDNTPEAQINVKYLFPLVYVYGGMKREDASLFGGVKIFGIRLVNFFPTDEEKKKLEEKKKKREEKRRIKEEKKRLKEEKKNRRKKTDASEPGTAHSVDVLESGAQDVDTQREELKDTALFDDIQNDEDFDDDSQKEKGPGFIEKIRLFILSLADMFGKLFDKLMQVQAFLAGLPDDVESRKNEIANKLKKLKALIKRGICIWEKDYTKKALEKAKCALIKILKAVRPRKGYVNVRLGMEDVAVTGQIAGYYGMLYGMFYPFVGRIITLEPDFNEKVMDVKGDLSGRIRLCSFLRAAWLYFFDRDVKHLKAVIKKTRNDFG